MVRFLDWDGVLHRPPFYISLLCIIFTALWFYYVQRASRRQSASRSVAPIAVEDKTVRFETRLATSTSFQRPSTSSFWRRSTRSMDESNSAAHRSIRLYSDPGTHRVDHQADMELLERTQQQRSTTSSTTTRGNRMTNEQGSTATGTSTSPPLSTTATTSSSPTSIAYPTWVPPPTWSETRRRTFLAAHVFARTLILHLDTGQLEGGIATDNTTAAVSNDDVWVCPTERVEAGVLRVYTSATSSPTEHSFRSAQAAAQFQWDWIAVQTLGTHIYNLYRVLALVHQGSAAGVGTEPVLHDDSKLEAVSLVPIVAWDDAMRSLGMYFPSIRFRLEAFHALKGQEDLRNNDTEQQQSLLSPTYQSKRLLLRLVDFFRLFVPQLPSTALPERDCARLRMERLLQTRKRVAKAAVLVQAYAHACTIVHRGLAWTANNNSSEQRRRLAYDTNWDNAQHDSSIVAAAQQPEYYEASVSRDIHIACASNCVASVVGYQSYSLVGMQTYPWRDNMLVQNPVQAFPLIQALLQQHAQHQFWIQSFYFETRRVICVQVYVRSLARSVDQRLDSAIVRYASNGNEYRDAQLTLYVQLGLALDGLSWLGSFLLLLLTMVLKRGSLSAQAPGGRGANTEQTPTDDMAGRTGLPGLRLADVSDTYHYGNAHTNYLACASVWGLSSSNRPVSKLLLAYLESGIFALLADLTLVLTDAPQRALCTARIVQPMTKCSQQKQPRLMRLVLDLALPMITDPVRRWWKQQQSTVQTISAANEQRHHCRSPAAVSSILSASPSLDGGGSDEDDGYFLTKIPLTQSVYIEQAVTKIIDILRSLEQRTDVADGFFRAFTRHDILRHFVAEQCNLRRALVRIVASAKWRHATFPIDLRTCRVELQNRQFCQNGFDRKGRPIFCFRTTLLGPWRKDEDAVLAAVLHTFDEGIQQLSHLQPLLQCVLIVVLGSSARNGRSGGTEESGDLSPDDVGSSPPDEVLSEQATFDSTVSTDFLQIVDRYGPTKQLPVPAGRTIQPMCLTWDNCSPRVPPDEVPKNHSNQSRFYWKSRIIPSFSPRLGRPGLEAH